MYTIAYLKENSKLPGPRGNLELLHKYSVQADAKSISECLREILPETSNSPEEFVGMCGIVAYAVQNSDSPKETISYLRKYASHQSWRIREAVAIGLQEMAEGRINEIQENLSTWLDGNLYEKRTVVAALCEPKLLKDKLAASWTLEKLKEIIEGFSVAGKMCEEERVLRKALGYGLSVAIVGLPEKGKLLFEKLLVSAETNKQVQWILKENLKKNRLRKMDETWSNEMKERLEF